MDLVIFYSPEKETVTYYINNDSAGYKIEYSFEYIESVTLDQGDQNSSAEGASQSGGIVVKLLRPPRFFMDSSGSGGFYEVGDFTENQQASKEMTHYLGGQAKVLSGQLARLLALESFHARHQKAAAQQHEAQLHHPPQPQFAFPQAPMKFPVATRVMGPPMSPVHRPQSQPNHFMDDSQLNLFQTPSGAPSGLQPPRGHKRQRSRSVPVAIDWSMMRQPMPSFLQTPMAAPDGFVNSPDVTPGTMFTEHQTPSFPLSIDTSATFPMEFRQPPMSATTAPSPSEFGTPAFFSSAGPDAHTRSEMTTPFNVSIMSPIPDSTTAPVLSMRTPSIQPDPVIANQSPPMTSFGSGPAESDMFQFGQDGAMMGDDSLNFQAFDFDTKQPLMTLPMRLQGLGDEHSQSPTPGPAAYIDPSNLQHN